VAVGGEEVGCIAPPATARLEKGRAKMARLIAFAWLLDLYDFGAEVAQNLRCPGRRQHAAEIEHTDMRERAQSDLCAHAPELRIEGKLQGFAEVGDAGGATGARRVADDALDRFHVTEAPEVESILDVNELLSELVEIPMCVHVAIDRAPHVGHAIIG